MSSGPFLLKLDFFISDRVAGCFNGAERHFEALAGIIPPSPQLA
jgi:hypothetical protein